MMDNKEYRNLPPYSKADSSGKVLHKSFPSFQNLLERSRKKSSLDQFQRDDVVDSFSSSLPDRLSFNRLKAEKQPRTEPIMANAYWQEDNISAMAMRGKSREDDKDVERSVKNEPYLAGGKSVYLSCIQRKDKLLLRGFEQEAKRKVLLSRPRSRSVAEELAEIEASHGIGTKGEKNFGLECNDTIFSAQMMECQIMSDFEQENRLIM